MKQNPDYETSLEKASDLAWEAFYKAGKAYCKAREAYYEARKAFIAWQEDHKNEAKPRL